MKFLEKDIKQITDLGLTEEKVNAQIDCITSGMNYANLVAAATIGKGILKIEDKQQEHYIKSYDAKRDHLNIVKFVPASGAATRMFKFLFQFLQKCNSNGTDIKSHINDDISKFIDGLEKFPFYESVIRKSQDVNIDLNTLSSEKKAVIFIETMLGDQHLNFGFYPKGLLPFHKYSSEYVTAFKEHLYEASLYASSNNEANLHFTISEVHKTMFEEELARVIDAVKKETNTSFNISFSYQSRATDTIATTLDNTPYRADDGSLLFRPSGHGALIENLNTLDYDLIFIKNIDNIVTYDKNKKVSNYKKLVAGILLELQETAFKYLRSIDDNVVTEDMLEAMVAFLTEKMNIVINESFSSYTFKEKTAYIFDRLNRPIRVCGMVKNEGEPGGGPFWVKDENGNIALQIIEFAQIDIDNQTQKDIVANATHFNPVDIVCGVKNYKGTRFDLSQFVDPKAAFITQKSQNGVDIKALELPGLWNGSMAYWNTIFVEVPVSTFSPVKTVNDLLKPAHQV